MKRILIVLKPFYLLFFLANPLFTAAQVSGIWSGTVTYKRVFTSIVSNGETTCIISIRDNRAHGTVQEKSDVTIEGKVICTSSCSAAGEASLRELFFNEGDGVWRLYVMSPYYTCHNTGSGCDAPVVPNHVIDITADPPRGNSLAALSGSETITNDMDGLGNMTTTVSWSLTRSRDVELIVTPDNYDKWLPTPGVNELKPGPDIMKVSLKLQGKNGAPLKVKAKSFGAKLLNTSSEPGTTLNTPMIPVPDIPDLGFLSLANTRVTGNFQEASINCGNCVSAAFSIGSFDGGGWTTLKAWAIVENDTVWGNLLVSGGETEIPIPKREPGSKIATSWLNAYRNPGEMDDKEETTGNTNHGDGLTAYEEYRGVIADGKFRRLDPGKKELGVWLKRAESPLFDMGIDWFENATHVKIIRFYENEIGKDRRLNKNAFSAHVYDQYVLRLEKKQIRKNVLGRVTPGPGIPKTVQMVMIDYDQIVQNQLKIELEAKKKNIALPFTLPEMVAKTVAHELAHGVNVWHHGNEELLSLNRVIKSTDPVRIFLPYDRGEITERDYHLQGLAGKSGGQGSGDIFCFVNYNPSYDWAVKESNNSFVFYMVPLLPVSSLMCNSSDGTDINATPNYFGHATKGNCMSQITLKD